MNKTRILEHCVKDVSSVHQLVELAANTLIEHKACTTAYKYELLELLDELGVYASNDGVLSLSVESSSQILQSNIEVIVTIEGGLDVNNLVSGLVYLIKVSTGLQATQ